jgi:RNA polymerase sigma-70 factor, ECF subfamily
MDHKKLTAAELIQLCLDANDEAAWIEFVRRFGRLIAGVITKRLRRYTGIIPNPSLIDDLTQDTYVKLCANNFRALREFDFQHENALCGFLKVVASNVVDDYIRSSLNQKRDQRREVDLDQIGSMTPAKSSNSVERKIRMEEIKKCLQEQAAQPNFARDYAIFWLYYCDGLTAKEIAERPSIRLTVKGVESTLLRLTRIVRNKLGGSPGRKRASGA